MTKHALLLAALVAAPASAHVTIEDTSARAGGYAKVVLRVTHGCSGSPTKSIAVHVPPGFLFAKANVKPGWSVTYERTPLAEPVDLHGRLMTQTTSVVRWEGGTVPNDQFDEFALQGRIDEKAPRQLAFRVVQTCEKGSTDWKDVPAGQEPAPVLEVGPAGSAGGHRH